MLTRGGNFFSWILLIIELSKYSVAHNTQIWIQTCRAPSNKCTLECTACIGYDCFLLKYGRDRSGADNSSWSIITVNANCKINHSNVFSFDYPDSFKHLHLCMTWYIILISYYNQLMHRCGFLDVLTCCVWLGALKLTWIKYFYSFWFISKTWRAILTHTRYLGWFRRCGMKTLE